MDALGALSVSCHEAITKEDPKTPTVILDLICSACRKKVKKYRESAFSCLEKVSKVAANYAKMKRCDNAVLTQRYLVSVSFE